MKKKGAIYLLVVFNLEKNMNYKKEQKLLCKSCIDDIKGLLLKCENHEHTFKNDKLGVWTTIGVSGWKPVIDAIRIISVKLTKNGRIYVKLESGRTWIPTSKVDTPNDLFDLYETLLTEVNN